MLVPSGKEAVIYARPIELPLIVQTPLLYETDAIEGSEDLQVIFFKLAGSDTLILTFTVLSICTVGIIVSNFKGALTSCLASALLTVTSYIYKLPEDSLRATRGFLVVSGTMADEHVTIIVCHLPSRGATSFYREEGGAQVKVVKDSLIAEDPNVKLFVMGDMNDDPQDKSMAKCLGAKRKISEVGDGDMYNPWWDVLASGTGTFDQIILSPSLLDKEKTKDYSTLKLFSHQIFRRDYLFQKEGKYKGNTLRTHAGGVWLNGYSDHLPTVVYLIKEQK